MPMTYHWDASARVLRTRITGHVTDVDLTEHLACIVADPTIGAPLREVVDMTDAERVDFSSNRLQQLAIAASHHGPRFGGMRTAIIAPSDSTFGISRMYELLADAAGSPIAVAVFRSRDAAEAWLQERGARA